MDLDRRAAWIRLGTLGAREAEAICQQPFKGRTWDMAGWWQLKYFLFSQLPGEMIQFDYIMFFRWVETTNQLIAYRILIGTSSFSDDLGMSNVKVFRFVSSYK